MQIFELYMIPLNFLTYLKYLALKDVHSNFLHSVFLYLIFYSNKNLDYFIIYFYFSIPLLFQSIVVVSHALPAFDDTGSLDYLPRQVAYSTLGDFLLFP